jgi:hypothetical protein
MRRLQHLNARRRNREQADIRMETYQKRLEQKTSRLLDL